MEARKNKTLKLYHKDEHAEHVFWWIFVDFFLSKRKIEYFELGLFELLGPLYKNRLTYVQWLFLVPVKGGIGGIFDPPIGRKYTTYIPLIDCLQGGLYATYHLLREPETTVDMLVV